jgi:zinc/manganese transport system substrate-binding protein
MMKLLRTTMIAAFSLFFAASLSGQQKKVRVVCTLPTLKSLAEEVGGDRVDVIALAKGDQDPHFVTPTPVLMRKTREADLFIENGFSLELWADEVVNGSGNSRIFRGTPGRILAGAGIPTLEIPSVLTRELGDIHPQGNPHVWLDPLLAKVEAANIAEALKRIDPSGTEYYGSRLDSFKKRIDIALFGPDLVKIIGIPKLTRLAWSGELFRFLDINKLNGKPLSAHLGGWLEQAESLRGIKAIEFHKVWVYFARIFGIQLMGTVEERPGIPPGPQHVRQVTELVRSQNIPLIMVDNFYDPSLPNSIARQTGAKVVLLPNQVEGDPGIKTYFDLIDHLIRQLTGAVKTASSGGRKAVPNP